MASISKNILTDGSTFSSICLWILFSAICSPATTMAVPPNERSEDPSASTQFHLNHLKSSIDSLQDPVHQSEYYMAEPSFVQLPIINRLLSRYRDTKRSWQNLQSSWGKRDGNGDGNGATNLYDEDENNAEDYSELLMLLSKVYGLGAAGRSGADYNGEANGGEDFIGVGEKRAWNKMNTAWGKRLAAARNNNGKHTLQCIYVTDKL